MTKKSDQVIFPEESAPSIFPEDQNLFTGITRREFLQYCTHLATLMALPASTGKAFADALINAPRPSVIWLPFQECTGCSEAITRSHTPTLDSLIFDSISLDYHHTLQAAAGNYAEKARTQAMTKNWGKYLVVVEGSLSIKDNGVYSTIAGVSNHALLQKIMTGAAAVIAFGNCASFGGLPAANPNPTGAVPISDIITDKPLVNIPGCPPLPTVMTGIIVYYLTYNKFPRLDDFLRPLSFYGKTIHDNCYRRTFFRQGKFAQSFGDYRARKGWCLFKLGCRGPMTYNSCTKVKWNNATSFPTYSGHGCLGCSEPGFWDAGDFYSY